MTVSIGDELRRAPMPADLDRLLHDVRGPLNAAVMHLEVLKRVVPDEATTRASLQSIQTELERLTAMLPLAFGVCALEMGPARRLLLRGVVESAIDEAARKRVQVEPGASAAGAGATPFRTLSGRCSVSMSPLPLSTTARWITLRSSRTLPGHP